MNLPGILEKETHRDKRTICRHTIQTTRPPQNKHHATHQNNTIHTPPDFVPLRARFPD